LIADYQNQNRETKSIFAKEMKQKWMIQQPKMVF
jgi:hypothetical protein